MNVMEKNKEIFKKIMSLNELVQYVNMPYINMENEIKIINDNLSPLIYMIEDLPVKLNLLNLDFIEAFIQRYENVLVDAIKIEINLSSLLVNESIVTKNEIDKYTSLEYLLINYIFVQDTLLTYGGGRNLQEILLKENNEDLGLNLVKIIQNEENKAHWNLLTPIIKKYISDEAIDMFAYEININNVGLYIMKNKTFNRQQEKQLLKMLFDELTKIKIKKYENGKVYPCSFQIYKALPIEYLEMECLVKTKEKELLFKTLGEEEELNNLYQKRKAQVREQYLNGKIGERRPAEEKKKI